MKSLLIAEAKKIRLWDDEAKKELAHFDLDEAKVDLLNEFAERYQSCLLNKNEQKLLSLGQDLYRWVDDSSKALTRSLEEGDQFSFEVRSRKVRGHGPEEWAVLNAPWEILANENGFLALDDTLGFSPVRRLGNPVTPDPLDDKRLGLMFMAASPIGQKELDYEKEEVAIIQAVGDEDIDLVVEESGNPDVLGKRWAKSDSLQVMHLSCHGHNAWRPGSKPKAKPVPVLLMEDLAGEALPVSTSKLLNSMGGDTPRMLFLSACLSASGGTCGIEEDDDRAQVGNSLASALVQSGMPAVLGWDGKVSDSAASIFAMKLYAHLAKKTSVEDSAATARRELVFDGGKTGRENWHLARVWLGRKGGGPIVGGC